MGVSELGFLTRTGSDDEEGASVGVGRAVVVVVIGGGVGKAA